MKSIMLAALLLTGCVTDCPLPVTPPVPTFQGQLFVGDASKKAVVRAQSDTTISCEDPKFSEMVCMAHADFLDLLTELRALRERAAAGGNAR